MPMWMILLIASIIVFLGIVPAFLLSYVIFSVLLKRTKPEKWGHGYSEPSDSEIVTMYDTGDAWRAEHAEVRESKYIENDGLRLYGEYFDFGHDRTVIILAGRMECCVYACYFAEPYRRAGYNVFVPDVRSHGFSEGKYNYLGFREYRDVLAWGKWLHEEKGNRIIVLHGVCIGASTSLFTLTSPDCPDYFTAMTAEGMYDTFYESTKNHMKKDKRPLFPFLYLVMLYVRMFTGVRPISDGPIRRIEQLNRPVLFIHGRQDLFSLPANAEALYARCPSDKRMVWFDKGAHSRLRINNTEAYDEAVQAFLTEHIKSVDLTHV